MNFNATRNVNHSGGIRKAKRVSDVASMGAPSPIPAFNASSPQYDASAISNANTHPIDPNMYNQNNYLDPSIQMDFENNGGPSQPYTPKIPVTSPFPQSPAQFGAVFQQPIVQDMAMQYGQQLASQGKDIVNREFEKYVPVSKLKYYFAVDTRYVMKKLILIFFPFTHKDWTVKYEQDHPVQPRYELNAPDLYIPTMAYVTYILLAGFMLGMQHRFSPEQIGIQASSALAYIIFEMILYLVTLYVTNISTNLRTLDLLSFSGYKYAVMIASLLSSIAFHRTGYYLSLVYSSFALAFFLVRTLKVQVLAGAGGAPQPQETYGYAQNPYIQSQQGSKRRVYFLLFVAILQPVLSWWLSYHLVPAGTIEPLVEEP